MFEEVEIISKRYQPTIKYMWEIAWKQEQDQ